MDKNEHVRCIEIPIFTSLDGVFSSICFFFREGKTVGSPQQDQWLNYEEKFIEAETFLLINFIRMTWWNQAFIRSIFETNTHSISFRFVLYSFVFVFCSSLINRCSFDWDSLSLIRLVRYRWEWFILRHRTDLKEQWKCFPSIELPLSRLRYEWFLINLWSMFKQQQFFFFFFW